MVVKFVDNYFSGTLKWTVAIGSTAVSGYLIFTNAYLWIIFILGILSLILFSTKYMLIIDTTNKEIIDSFYFLWIKTQSEEFKFNRLNGIRLDKQRHTYNAGTRSRDRTADFNEYIATLEYDQDKSIELTRNMEYQVLAKEIERIASRLNLSISRTF